MMSEMLYLYLSSHFFIQIFLKHLGIYTFTIILWVKKN